MLKQLGIYLHIPFCIQKCHYCDFNSFVSTEEQKEIYTDALLKEIEEVSKYADEHYLDTIFFGGGTPSVLGFERLKKIMDKLKFCFFISDDAEITIEVNPKTANFKDFKEYKKMGINRISLGVQSMSDNELELIGRSHRLKDFLECYASLKLAGFENVNYDLMFGLPNQTLKDFEKNLTDILKYRPKHISCYSLQLEENTYLNIHKEEFVFPNDELNRKMYYLARDILEKNGYMQYEISNFAKSGFESKHNLKYWELKEYLGVGLGASSYFENTRYQNPEKFEEYVNFADNFIPLWENNERQTENQLMSEFMFLGLRKTKGISDNDFKEMFGKSFFDVYSDVINKHLKNNLLIKEDNLRFTQKGMDLSNFVLCDFV